MTDARVGRCPRCGKTHGNWEKCPAPASARQPEPLKAPAGPPADRMVRRAPVQKG